MPRPLRIHYANAWYHVMNRGAGRNKIFRNNTQRSIFLELLGECNKMFNIQIHAYCLMDNHYHLLISTPDANLSRAMRHLNGVYTQRYNRMMKTDGPLFKGRYKSQLVDEDSYLLIVSRYIHLNPVKADLIGNPANYKWSSYSAYIGKKRKPNWLSISVILDMLKNTSLLSHVKDYQEYVEHKDMEEINVFSSMEITEPILGSIKFKEKIVSQIDANIKHACAADINRVKIAPDIELIITKICDFYKLDRSCLVIGKQGALNWPRLVFMYVSRKLYGHSLKTISEPLGCPYRSTVSAGILKCKQKLLSNPELKEEISMIYQAVKNMIE